MVVCPYCEQDYVWNVRVCGISDPLLMCLECDTVWTSAADVRNGTGLIFKRFMEQRQLVPDWKGIEKLSRLTRDGTSDQNRP